MEWVYINTFPAGKFSKVVFVDDQAHYLEQMRQKVSALGMEFLGILYQKKTEQYALLANMDDVRVGAQQLLHFHRHRTWISQEAARALLKEMDDMRAQVGEQETTAFS